MSKTVNEFYVLELLKKNNMGILATVKPSGAPHASPIYFVPHASFEMFFVTPTKTEKYENIQANNAVALTIVSQDRTEMVSIEGHAVETSEKLEIIIGQLARSLAYGENFLSELPLLQYHKQKRAVLKIVPTYIRYRQYGENTFFEKIIKPAS